MLQEHHLTNARTIVSVVDGGTEFGSLGSLFTSLGRARNWGGELTEDELLSLLSIVEGFEGTGPWNQAAADIAEAIKETLHEIHQVAGDRT